jgi:hypothetical protein
MTDDAKSPEMFSERMHALEVKVLVLEKAMNAAFGVTWMEQITEQVKAEE